MALLEDTAVLVDGGSQGVGAGMVRAALRESATVAFTGRRAEERAAERLPMGTPCQVDEVADFVVLLRSDRSGVVTGSVIDWNQDALGASG